MSALLPCVEVDPPVRPRCAVIWLHGLGADGHDFEPIVPELGLPAELGVRFVFPHAPIIPVTLNMGMPMRAWYDIRQVDLRREHDAEGILRAAGQVRALIARETESGIPASRIVLAGFSQGGAIALFTGLRHPETLAGIVALSTYLVLEESLDAEAAPANRATPIFQAHGTADPMVAFERGAACRDALRARGYTVEWHDYPMPHAVHPREIADIGDFLRRRLATPGE